MPNKIGPYTVVSQLGRGGMGVVYKGRDESLNRFVAIKVLTEGLTEDPTFLQRFVREAQAAASLSHPNVVQIYFNGEDDEGHPYFVMEFVPGRSLDLVLRSEGMVGNPRASQLILQAAHGLAAAHDVGIIHRDIKPANLMLDDRGLVKIADFGLALPPGAETRLTASGMFVGTPGYLSPEQCAGETADHRTDIYALGVTYYMLLTGTPPFRGESPLALIKQILDANPADVSTVNPNVDPESRRILAKMIAKEREHRYQSCHDLIADLENLLASQGVRSMTAGLAARSPSSTPELAAALAAPTQTLASSGVAPAAVPAETPTLPETPLAGAPTSPAIDVAATAPPPRRSSRNLLIAAVLAFLLIGGGAVAAVMYGMKTARGFTATPVEAEAAPPATRPVNNPSQDLLLSQAIVPPAEAPQASEPVPVPEPEGDVERNPERNPQRLTTPSPAPRAAARAPRGIAVAATGDPGLNGFVAQVVRSEFESAGLEIVDAHVLPSTEDLLRRDDAPAKRLIDTLRAEGFALLVLARIEPVGQRQLSYYGRTDIAYSSRVTLTTYELASGRPVTSSQGPTIEYTSINAESEAEDAVTPLARATAKTIRDR